MEALSVIDYDVDFGGQNQIVNQQEQNREVNPGGLSQTDSETSLNGSTAGDQEMMDKTADSQKSKASASSEEKEEIETPARKLETAL